MEKRIEKQESLDGKEIIFVEVIDFRDQKEPPIYNFNIPKLDEATIGYKVPSTNGTGHAYQTHTFEKRTVTIQESQRRPDERIIEKLILCGKCHYSLIYKLSNSDRSDRTFTCPCGWKSDLLWEKHIEFLKFVQVQRWALVEFRRTIKVYETREVNS